MRRIKRCLAKPSLGPLTPVCAVLALTLVLGASGATGAPDAALVYGTYALGPESVVDGDTLRIAGQPSVRIMCIDTEETFKRDADRAAATADFDAYARAARAESPRPVKFGTPMGEAARTYFGALVSGVTQVRLERDRVGGREVDPYGRRLAHAVLLTADGEVNLALAMIRSGFSPYFVKYGRSRRFDRVFRDAEADARLRRRGIWGAEGPGHYPDYDERLQWWHARADQVDRWRAVERPGRIMLGAVETAEQLAAFVGKEATVFGVFSRKIETRDGSRTILLLGDRKRRGFPLVVFDEAVLGALDMTRIDTMYVTATGRLSLFKGQPQMVVERADQISTD